MNRTSIGIRYSSNPMHISAARQLIPRPAYVTALRCQIITPISFLLQVRLSVCPPDNALQQKRWRQGPAGKSLSTSTTHNDPICLLHLLFFSQKILHCNEMCCEHGVGAVNELIIILMQESLPQLSFVIECDKNKRFKSPFLESGNDSLFYLLSLKGCVHS